MCRTLGEELPRLDAIVHNASSYERTPLASVSAEELLSAYRVNAAAPLLISRGLAALLSRSGEAGRTPGIVTMCDVHALGEHGLPRKDYSAYAMSKAALVEVTRVLARELAPGVRVNGLAIGVAAWPESGPDADPELQSEYVRGVPLRRAGTAEEAARAVLWLARDAQYTTGQILRFDGGRSML